MKHTLRLDNGTILDLEQIQKEFKCCRCTIIIFSIIFLLITIGAIVIISEVLIYPSQFKYYFWGKTWLIFYLGKLLGTFFMMYFMACKVFPSEHLLSGKKSLWASYALLALTVAELLFNLGLLGQPDTALHEIKCESEGCSQSKTQSMIFRIIAHIFFIGHSIYSLILCSYFSRHIKNI